MYLRHVIISLAIGFLITPQLFATTGAWAPEGLILLTTTTVASGVGTTVMIVTLMDNKHTSLKDAEKAEKLAEIFIRDNSINIGQNISSGEGKIVNELASALEIKPELRLHFGSLLKKQRIDLMSLANIRNLTPKRAGEFIRFVAQLSENDLELKTSILMFKKKHNI